jgi:FkbM family methyltransferase
MPEGKTYVLAVASYWSHTFLPGLIREDGIVFDLGVNSGGFVNLVATGCARVVGFEPDPSWHGKYQFPENVSIIAKAVAARRGVLHLNVNPTQCSSLHYAETGARVVEVEAVTLEDALALDPNARIEVLKMDIEGEEVAVLQEAPAKLFKRVAQITVEFHDFLDPASVPAIKRVIQRMRDLGFLAFRMSWHSYGDMLFVNQALEPLTLTQRFYLGIYVKYSEGFFRILRRIYNRA